MPRPRFRTEASAAPGFQVRQPQELRLRLHRRRLRLEPYRDVNRTATSARVILSRHRTLASFRVRRPLLLPLPRPTTWQALGDNRASVEREMSGECFGNLPKTKTVSCIARQLLPLASGYSQVLTQFSNPAAGDVPRCSRVARRLAQKSHLGCPAQSAKGPPVDNVYSALLIRCPQSREHPRALLRPLRRACVARTYSYARRTPAVEFHESWNATRRKAP